MPLHCYIDSLVLVQVPKRDYKLELDPKLYSSKKTG